MVSSFLSAASTDFCHFFQFLGEGRVLFSQKGVETWYGISNSNVPLTDQLHNGLQLLFYPAQVLHVICNYIFVSSYSVSNWWEMYLSCKSLAINRQTVH